MVVVQEMHVTKQDQLKLDGFTLANCTLSAHHGIATFIKNQIGFTHTDNSNEKNPTKWVSVKVENTSIMNIYHPPLAVLRTRHLDANY